MSSEYIDKILSQEYLSDIERHLQKCMEEFNSNDPKVRTVFAHIVGFGLILAVCKETGSQFVARKAEKRLYQILGVPDIPWKLRFYGWFWRCWNWIKRYGIKEICS